MGVVQVRAVYGLIAVGITACSPSFAPDHGVSSMPAQIAPFYATACVAASLEEHPLPGFADGFELRTPEADAEGQADLLIVTRRRSYAAVIADGRVAYRTGLKHELNGIGPDVGHCNDAR